MGETLAESYLKERKYKILEKNYSNYLGEIDLIALNDEVIVFIEVKLRNSLEYGAPCEAVTPFKQRKIRSVAMYYLQKNNLTDKDCRFDVIEVFDDKVKHIENCF